MFVAFIDQESGNSTPRCSEVDRTVPPVRHHDVPALPGDSSWGAPPGVVWTRSTFNAARCATCHPLGDRLVAAAVPMPTTSVMRVRPSLLPSLWRSGGQVARGRAARGGLAALVYPGATCASRRSPSRSPRYGERAIDAGEAQIRTSSSRQRTRGSPTHLVAGHLAAPPARMLSSTRCRGAAAHPVTGRRLAGSTHPLTTLSRKEPARDPAALTTPARLPRPW